LKGKERSEVHSGQGVEGCGELKEKSLEHSPRQEQVILMRAFLWLFSEEP